MAKNSTEKIMLALGVETGKELAQKLGISEPAVNNAKRHGNIPGRWLLYAVCHSWFRFAPDINPHRPGDRPFRESLAGINFQNSIFLTIICSLRPSMVNYKS